MTGLADVQLLAIRCTVPSFKLHDITTDVNTESQEQILTLLCIANPTGQGSNVTKYFGYSSHSSLSDQTCNYMYALHAAAIELF